MATLALSLALLGAAFLAHLALWRVWLPRPATAVLLALFLGALPVGLAVAAWPCDLPTSAGAALQVILFHVAWSLAYVIVYHGIETTSPSLAVARAVERAGAGGCSWEELAKTVSDADFLERRLALLRGSGLVVDEGSCCRLTGRGARVAWLMTLIARGVLNLPKGG